MMFLFYKADQPVSFRLLYVLFLLAVSLGLRIAQKSSSVLTYVFVLKVGFDVQVRAFFWQAVHRLLRQVSLI